MRLSESGVCDCACRLSSTSTTIATTASLPGCRAVTFSAVDSFARAFGWATAGLATRRRTRRLARAARGGVMVTIICACTGEVDALSHHRTIPRSDFAEFAPLRLSKRTEY